MTGWSGCERCERVPDCDVEDYLGPGRGQLGFEGGNILIEEGHHFVEEGEDVFGQPQMVVTFTGNQLEVV